MLLCENTAYNAEIVRTCEPIVLKHNKKGRNEQSRRPKRYSFSHAQELLAYEMLCGRGDTLEHVPKKPRMHD